MSTNDTAIQESTDSRIRPKYVPLGTDADGAHHVYRTTDETVHVVSRETGREHVESVATRPVDEWMTFVDRRRGWSHKTYGVGIAELAARAFGGAEA